MFDVLSSVYSDLLKRFGWRKELEKEWKAIGDVEGGRGGGGHSAFDFPISVECS